MNDRLWTMKVVVEKVRKFICVIPLFSDFPISGTTNKPLSKCLSGMHLSLSGTYEKSFLLKQPESGTYSLAEWFS